MTCETCQYYVESNKGSEFCAYYCQFLVEVQKYNLCSWVKNDYSKNEDGEVTNKLQRM